MCQLLDDLLHCKPFRCEKRKKREDNKGASASLSVRKRRRVGAESFFLSSRLTVAGLHELQSGDGVVHQGKRDSRSFVRLVSSLASSSPFTFASPLSLSDLFSTFQLLQPVFSAYPHNRMTHPELPGADEIKGNLIALNALSGIPLAEIQGFRFPYLNYSAEGLTTLHELGFTYDSSATASSPVNSSSTDAFWFVPFFISLLPSTQRS